MALRSPSLLHRRSPVLLALVALLVAPQLAHAQDDVELPEVTVADSAPEAPASASPIVRAILVEAVAEHEAGHYAEAQALFRRAHELSPSARTLRGLGMASFELRRYADAVHALEAALTEPEHPLTDSQREHVEALLARARGFTASLRLDVTPTGASVRVDGAIPSVESDGSLLLDPGVHVISVEHEGHRQQTLELQIAPGTHESRTISLTVLPPEPPVVAPTNDGLWVAAAGFGGAAVIGLVAAAITGAISLVDSDQLRASCAGYVCSESLQATRDRARDLSVATDVVGTTAAILGATALALVVAGALNGSSTTASAACTADGCFASIGGAL